MIDLVLDIAFVFGLTAWSMVLGGMVARWFRCEERGWVAQFAICAPLGMGSLSLLVLMLGMAGAINRSSLTAVFASVILLFLYDLIRRMRRTGLNEFTAAKSTPRADRRLFATDVLLAITLVATFASACVPVTDGDALCYHLQVPKVFLQGGRAVYDPDLHETVYPLGTEMLYAVALAFRGPVACRLIQWVLGLIFAASVTELARPSLGGRARLAGLIALLVPAVSNGMSAPLNDVALAAFCSAALLAWTRWSSNQSTRTAALAGVMSGIAISVKYPALVWVGLLGSGTLATALQAGWQKTRDARRAWIGAAAFATLTIAVGGIWYARAYAFTGNPVHPFFKSVFGGSGLDEVLEPAKRPLAVTPFNMLAALWPVTLDPDRFDSVSHQFGPIFLMALPALLLCRPPKRVTAIVCFGLAFFTLCMTQRQSMRFVLAAVGPWSVGVAWLFERVRAERSRLARLCLLMLCGVIAFQAAIAVARTRLVMPLLLGRERVDEFLAKREPTFEMGRWIEAHLTADSKIIGQDHRGYYIPRPYTMELAHRRRTGLGDAGETPDMIVAQLRERGFTHLMLCPPVPEDAVEFDGTLNGLLRGWTERQTALTVQTLTDGDGVARRYAMYALDAPTALSAREGTRR